MEETDEPPECNWGDRIDESNAGEGDALEESVGCTIDVLSPVISMPSTISALSSDSSPTPALSPLSPLSPSVL